jgi:hypothetical protein
MDTTAKKKSFSEMLEENEAKKHNSDLSNLAQAMLYAKAAENEAKNLQSRIAALAKHIESGAIIGVDEVSSIYRQAQGLSTTERKRL